ncbi:hypothetical protein [Dactylosporangium salmoneum]|uniref:hypothetical protein n=1 Tax=Dactylosporangium salmoneum TaxID=53361 RepID=UPI0031D8B8FB
MPDLGALDNPLAFADLRPLDGCLGSLDPEQDPCTLAPQRLSGADGLRGLNGPGLCGKLGEGAIDVASLCIQPRKPRLELGPLGRGGAGPSFSQRHDRQTSKTFMTSSP